MVDVPVVFAAVTFDWGTITLKDLVYALLAFGALWLGKQKVWAWFYQLEDCRTTYQQQLEDLRADFKLQMAEVRASHKEQLEALRADFRTQLSAADERTGSFRDLLVEGRTLVRQSVESVTKLAERHAS